MQSHGLPRFRSVEVTQYFYAFDAREVVEIKMLNTLCSTHSSHPSICQSRDKQRGPSAWFSSNFPRLSELQYPQSFKSFEGTVCVLSPEHRWGRGSWGPTTCHHHLCSPWFLLASRPTPSDETGPGPWRHKVWRASSDENNTPCALFFPGSRFLTEASRGRGWASRGLKTSAPDLEDSLVNAAAGRHQFQTLKTAEECWTRTAKVHGRRMNTKDEVANVDENQRWKQTKWRRAFRLFHLFLSFKRKAIECDWNWPISNWDCAIWFLQGHCAFCN